MAAGTAVSRVLGLVRTSLLVAAIGVTGSLAADAFAVANRLPNVMFAILAAGVLNSVLVPQIVRAFRDGREHTVHRLLTLGGFWMVVTAAVLTAFAGFWVRVFSDDWGPEQTAIAAAFAFWCIPQLAFYGLYTLFGQVLNAREQFGPYMWAPAAANVVAITGLVTYLLLFGRWPADGGSVVDIADWSPLRIALIAGTATLGIVTQALILVPFMRRGGYRWRWTWRGPKGELAVVAKVASWALAAVLVEQVGVTFVTRVASAISSVAPHDARVAGVAAYDFALGIVLVPHSLVAISLMTVLFTRMSRHAAAGARDKVREVLSEGMRTVGVFSFLATAALIVAAPHLVRVVAFTGSAESVDAIAWVMRVLALSLVPLAASTMAKQVYFALEDGRSVFLIHVPMTLAWLAVAYGVKWSAGPEWWVRGVALGLFASNLVALVLRLWGLRRRLGGVDARRIGITYAKATLGAAVAAVVGVGLLLLGPESWREDGLGAIATSLGMAAAIGVAMTAAYVVTMRVLRTPELAAVASAVTRRFGRR